MVPSLLDDVVKMKSFKTFSVFGEAAMEKQPEDCLLKTQQVARALGVSVSTIKRWVDAGELKASKTVGRHRLIPVGEALSFARRCGLPRNDLEVLAGIGSPRMGTIDDRARQALEETLRTGRSREARALIRSAYNAGADAAALGDDLIRPVMERIGHGWQSGMVDIFEEHRASQVVGSILSELIGRTRPANGKRAPLALGATPDGDPYTLSGLLSELVLGESGWEAVNLGPNLPMAALARAVLDQEPRLVWLSINHLADPARFLRDYEAFHEAATRTGAAVILGGRALGPDLRVRLLASGFGERMAHLAEFARQLHPAGVRPRAVPTTDRPGSKHSEVN